MEQKNKNLAALLVGFGLIVLIALLTVVRPFFGKSNQSNPDGAFLSQTDPTAAKQISGEDLLKKIRSRESLSIIDVRDSAAFQKEHILDSQNLPAATFDPAGFSADKDRTYVFVDDGSDNSGLLLANNAAAQKDLPNVYSLTGGFTAWKNKLGPTVSAGDPNSFTDQAKVTYLSSDQLNNLLKSPNNLYLLDVRKSNTFAAGHLPGAVNIFLDDLEKRRRELPIGKTIVVYDSDGLWAFQAAVRLFDMNITGVSALSDGFNAWTQKKFAVTK